jgi:hypothetical protein
VGGDFSDAGERRRSTGCRRAPPCLPGGLGTRGPRRCASSRKRQLSLPAQAPPSTTISKRKLIPSRHIASFDFDSNTPGARFRCKLDAHALTVCGSPQTYKHLKAGRHIFSVVAVDAAGAQDPTPALAQFTIAR